MGYYEYTMRHFKRIPCAVVNVNRKYEINQLNTISLTQNHNNTGVDPVDIGIAIARFVSSFLEIAKIHIAMRESSFGSFTVRCRKKEAGR